MTIKKRYLLSISLLAIAAWLYFERVGHPEVPGTISAPARGAVLQAQTQSTQQTAAQQLGVEAPKQVLFGDLHVHTTYSVDAFAWSMPVFHGEGVHPPAEACDYARYCSNLDFWASTEHAESLTARHWRDIKNTVRQCNAVAGDPQNPDMVSFVGWEWTQMGNTPEHHYGHKNVILRDIEEERLPARPISAGGIATEGMKAAGRPYWQDVISPYVDFGSRQTQFDQQYKLDDLRKQSLCESGVPERQLPPDCMEQAEDPKTLFAKLDDWGFPALVIPHGNTWGFYTPPGSSWDKQLTREQHDPKRQRLIEVFSGHGNSEEFRNWQEVAFDSTGTAVCPKPTADYLPSCWRAGELIRARCGSKPAAECDALVQKAQSDYLASGRAGHMVVPGVNSDDWLDSGQCRDCFLPAFNYRPKVSTQYALALSNFKEVGEDGKSPLRFRFGFIASSDNHAAQPGTGYKQVGRHANTEVYGQDGFARIGFIDEAKKKLPLAKTYPFDLNQTRFNFMQIAESERVQSYFYTGGLVATHSNGRNRGAIWDALERREVYATSGERMLLWFDLLGANGSTAPMGSAVEARGAARFRVRVIGDFEQLPGCPKHSVTALTPAKIEQICRGECYNPSDTRKPIQRIEIVRILPQNDPSESIKDAIQDPWRVFNCSGDPKGCVVEFTDTDPAVVGREAIYYVRAIGTAEPTINASNLRCEFNDRQECIAVKPCFGDLRTPTSDDCKTPAAPRAWSSPIYVTARAP